MQAQTRKLRLLITRHGQTQQNIKQVICGQLPGVLTKDGIQQAKKIGLWLNKQKIPFENVYVSDLQRTKDTYKNILSKAQYLKNIKVDFTDLIRQKSGGVLNGKPLKSWKQWADKQKKSLRQYRSKNGQSWEDVYYRGHKFLKLIIEKHLLNNNQEQDIIKMMQDMKIQQNIKRILAVSHGGFIMEFHNVCRAISKNQQPKFKNSAENCSMHQFLIEYPIDMKQYNEKLIKIQCICENFTDHLK